jgi:hypothetical protein
MSTVTTSAAPKVGFVSLGCPGDAINIVIPLGEIVRDQPV